MRTLLLSSLFLLFTLGLTAQKKHIKQSKPFEQVLKALKKDKPETVYEFLQYPNY